MGQSCGVDQSCGPQAAEASSQKFDKSVQHGHFDTYDAKGPQLPQAVRRARGKANLAYADCLPSPSLSVGSFAVLRGQAAFVMAPPKPGATQHIGDRYLLEVPAGALTSTKACGKTVADEHWRRFYSTSQELGNGASAYVYGAEATMLHRKPAGSHIISLGCGYAQTLLKQGNVCNKGVSSSMYSCMQRHRQVAIKRFKKAGSRSFQTELAALLRVGTHPHVLRLLESYSGCDGEDVLILEYCDGTTVFELHTNAQLDAVLLPKLLVVRLMWQLFHALEHIHACGVEHQDVKPENLLLFNVSIPANRAHLKLGDFGWAIAIPPVVPSVGGKVVGEVWVDSVPAAGAGSLWYAPPELNPPVESLGGRDGQKLMRVPGRSDLWSAGVVMYLLLVGRNPFHQAQQTKPSKAAEAEVMRLVALGHFDKDSLSFRTLSDDVKSLISALLQVHAADRPSVSDVLKHSYFLRQLSGEPEMLPLEPGWRMSERDVTWGQLDGFQQLCWAAVARAIAENELYGEVVVESFRAMRADRNWVTQKRPATSQVDAMLHSSAYVWHLARELSALPIGKWLADRTAWSDVARLAFRYLDVDGDGSLSVQDLVAHLAADCSASQEAWAAVRQWLADWSMSSSADNGAAASGDPYRCDASLGQLSFRAAIASSVLYDDAGDDMDGDFDVIPFNAREFDEFHLGGRPEDPHRASWTCSPFG